MSNTPDRYLTLIRYGSAGLLLESRRRSGDDPRDDPRDDARDDPRDDPDPPKDEPVSDSDHSLVPSDPDPVSETAARAIAAAWAAEGGLIVPEEGRRPLVSGPWDSAVIESGDAAIGIDLDAPPAGGGSLALDAQEQVSISYGDGASTDEFAVIMVAAQHLEAWKMIFAPERAADLPSLSLLLEKLI